MIKDIMWATVAVLCILGSIVLLPFAILVGAVILCGVIGWFIYAYIHDQRLAEEEYENQKEYESGPHS